MASLSEGIYQWVHATQPYPWLTIFSVPEAQNEETSKSLTISRSEDTRKRPRRQLSDPDPDAGQRRRRQEPIQPSALDKGKARQSDSDDIDFEESDNSSTIVTRTGDPSVARSLPPLAAAASPRLSPPSGTGTAAMSRHSSSAPNRHSPTASTGRHGEHPSQLLTPSMSSDPRAMSQVSPGFIFVIFPMSCAELFCPLLPICLPDSQISMLPILNFLCLSFVSQF